MHPRQNPPDALLGLITAQDGVISRDQVLRLGLSRHSLQRLLDEGAWRSLGRGVYCQGEPTWRGELWAGVLMGGDRAVIGGAAAGVLHGLSSGEPRPIDVFASTDHSRRPGYRFHRAPRAAQGALPHTGVEDTLLDLAGETDAAETVNLLISALTGYKTTPKRMRRAMAARPRLPHRRLIESAVADVALGAHSELERRYLHDVERAHGLPRPIRQASTSAGRVDVRYDAWGVVIELDGAAHHGGLQQFRDMERDNRHVLEGLITLRFGWIDIIQRPCGVARLVAYVLQAHGWKGEPTPCRLCRKMDRT